jgi:hypothetical protein
MHGVGAVAAAVLGYLLGSLPSAGACLAVLPVYVPIDIAVAATALILAKFAITRTASQPG